MTKPLDYRRNVRGFGTWRVQFVPERKKWQLAVNVAMRGERWNALNDYDVLEAAVDAVARRNTGWGAWDGLGYGRAESFELSTWTEVSSGP